MLIKGNKGAVMSADDFRASRNLLNTVDVTGQFLTGQFLTSDIISFKLEWLCWYEEQWKRNAANGPPNEVEAFQSLPPVADRLRSRHAKAMMGARK